MTKAEAQNNNALPHDLILEGRGKLTVTGVRRMLRCDPDSAAMETRCGERCGSAGRCDGH